LAFQYKLVTRGKEISSFTDIMKLLLYPYMILAVTLYAGATLLWIYILTKIPLSKKRAGTVKTGHTGPVHHAAVPCRYLHAAPTFARSGIAVNTYSEK